MSTKYYAAVDHRDVIYGVGRTPEEALADAGQYRLKRLYTVPCTEGVYNELFDSTYTHTGSLPLSGAWCAWSRRRDA